MTEKPKMCMNCRFGIETEINICHAEEYDHDYPEDPAYIEYSIINCKNKKKFLGHLEFVNDDIDDDQEVCPDFTMLFTSHSVGCEYYEESANNTGSISRLWPNIWRQ